MVIYINKGINLFIVLIHLYNGYTYTLTLLEEYLEIKCDSILI